ncbi:MAG: DUF4349 domain-containing protein [Myxococcota bacterium]
MPHLKNVLLYTGVLALLLLTTACAGQLNRSRVMDETLATSGAKERLIIHSGDLALTVREPAAIQAEVEAIVKSESGIITHSTTSESSTWIESRIPADRLDTTMKRIAALGKATRLSVSAEDITEAHADLSSRLETSRQLRDRMRALLDRASDVKDLLAIETELARVQAEIEAMENHLDGLNSQVRLSRLSIRLEQKRVLGPLGFVGYWTGWALSKLFVIH